MHASRLVPSLALAAALMSVQSALAEDTKPPDKVSFYFAAHQDDWQLFMNPSAFEDVSNPRAKTIFVHVTAGDAGSAMNKNGRRFPYVLARENGAELAIRFMADAHNWPQDRVAANMDFNGHPIYRVSYRNTVAYFLRLPDGNLDGSGFAATSHQSLQRLALGQVAELTAIDGTTVYRGWSDLVTTVRAILDFERGDAPVVQLNVAETDARLNPRDHSDHQMTAKAALDAASRLACASRHFYVDYASSRMPANLSPQQRDMETSVVAVTAAGVLALDHGSIWQQYFQSYLGRNYFRVEQGIGRCGNPWAEVAAKR